MTDTPATVGAPRIIGLGHYSRVGKNTLASMIGIELARQAPGIRVKIVSFASKLKDIAHQLYSWDGMQDEAFYETPEGAVMRDVKLPTLQMTPIEVWVALGTPAIREHVYQNTWVDYTLKTDHKCDVLIVTDVRFPNEVEAINELGGILIKVVRDGYGPRSTVADMALADYDGWGYVAGTTMKDLAWHADYIACELRHDNDLVQLKSVRDKILSCEGACYVG
jgi:hypothetical protein